MCSIAKLLQENMEHRTLVVDLLADGEVVPHPELVLFTKTQAGPTESGSTLASENPAREAPALRLGLRV